MASPNFFMNQRDFGGIIWTHHALARLDQRGLTQDIAYNAFRYPDKVEKAREGGSEFVKWSGKSRITVIAKQNERGEWLVVSNWVDPPLYGTTDYYKKKDYQAYKRMPWWARMITDTFKAIGEIFK